MSLNAYRRVMRETVSPRDTERQILLRLTTALETHAPAFAAADPSSQMQILDHGLRAALTENLKFWLTLRIDLLSPENTLPDALRADLISLSVFVEKSTAAAMGGRSGLSALVSTNRSIIDGLAGLAGAAPEAQAATGAP